MIPLKSLTRGKDAVTNLSKNSYIFTPGHGGDNLPKAQAIKDATMAYFILKNLDAGELFMHYNGSYHSDDYEGINWYLKQEKPNLNIVTVSVVEQENLKKLDKESKLKANFIIVIPPTMTKTY